MEKIDRVVLANLMDGNMRLVEKYLDIFKTQAPQQVRDLNDQIKKKEWEMVSNTAHSLKSQFEYLSLQQLVELASQIELSADENITYGISLLASTLEEQLGQVIKREFDR